MFQCKHSWYWVILFFSLSLWLSLSLSLSLFVFILLGALEWAHPSTPISTLLFLSLYLPPSSSAGGQGWVMDGCGRNSPLPIRSSFLKKKFNSILFWGQKLLQLRLAQGLDFLWSDFRHASVFELSPQSRSVSTGPVFIGHVLSILSLFIAFLLRLLTGWGCALPLGLWTSLSKSALKSSPSTPLNCACLDLLSCMTKVFQKCFKQKRWALGLICWRYNLSGMRGLLQHKADMFYVQHLLM